MFYIPTWSKNKIPTLINIGHIKLLVSQVKDPKTYPKEWGSVWYRCYREY